MPIYCILMFPAGSYKGICRFDQLKRLSANWSANWDEPTQYEPCGESVTGYENPALPVSLSTKNWFDERSFDGNINVFLLGDKVSAGLVALYSFLIKLSVTYFAKYSGV